MKQTVYIKSVNHDKVVDTFALTKIVDKSFVQFITKQEGYFYTKEQLKQLLQDYTDKIVENVKISRESTGEGESSDSLISDSFEGDLGYEDYIPVEYTIYKESITNQLELFLKDVL